MAGNFTMETGICRTYEASNPGVMLTPYLIKRRKLRGSVESMF